MTENRSLRLKLLLITLSCLLLLTGCEKEKPKAFGKRPNPKVEIITVKTKPYTTTIELPGRIAPERVAEVRARVAGIVLSRNFEEGSEVKKGDILFQIDPAPFEATLAQAQASLANAQAELFQCRAVVERYKSLVKVGAISPQKNDTALANYKKAQAAEKAALAKIKTAKLNLGYATVKAPISGRIGRALVTEGSLVGQGEATRLAKIQQLDPIYADVTQPVSDFLRLRAALTDPNGKDREKRNDQATITLDEIGYTQKGHFLFTDVTVDRSTGQVSLRSEFPNPHGLLLPNMFVRIKIKLGTDPDAIFIPQRAITRNSTGGASVMVIGDDGVAKPRPVKTGAMQGTTWQILEGLKPGERIVASGVAKVRSGMKFQVKKKEQKPIQLSDASLDMDPEELYELGMLWALQLL